MLSFFKGGHYLRKYGNYNAFFSCLFKIFYDDFIIFSMFHSRSKWFVLHFFPSFLQYEFFIVFYHFTIIICYMTLVMYFTILFRGVFSMGALAPAIFGHLSTVGKNVKMNCFWNIISLETPVFLFSLLRLSGEHST